MAHMNFDKFNHNETLIILIYSAWRKISILPVHQENYFYYNYEHKLKKEYCNNLFTIVINVINLYLQIEIISNVAFSNKTKLGILKLNIEIKINKDAQ